MGGRKHVRAQGVNTPNRVDITEWISMSWGDLAIETIVSGFAKVGIFTDTRVAEAMPTEDAPQIESYIVEELENCNIVDGEVGSDDDIENESDSDDESNLYTIARRYSQSQHSKSKCERSNSKWLRNFIYIPVCIYKINIGWRQ
ncbi:unnamed protein product [Phytophthora fragariaefolia]|uniref:Unnamed protein product n=1 Tax=Phytophthora fragariaefolia TaxID=1490495 RepID=A0A9W6Y3A2_9STRA|nr:unnamed protein product [Phytophthora fragariaefolia]